MSHASVNASPRDNALQRDGHTNSSSSVPDPSLLQLRDPTSSGSDLAQRSLAKQLVPGQLASALLPPSIDKPATRKYQFATTSSDILRKYSKFPPSLSLHIFDTFYRFNNAHDSAPIPRNSPMMKVFLEHVLKEEIPAELSELLKDFSYRSYDGCLVLQVSDHRNMISVSVPQPAAKPVADPTKQDSAPGQASPPAAPTSILKPKSYRTLLRPTPLSLYYDLLYHTDAALTKFSDPLALQMESEILTLTNRNLDLTVKLNPYDYPELASPHMYPQVENDKSADDTKLVLPHREEVPVIPRKLHLEEQILHKSSEYEELMLLMTKKHSKLDDLVQNTRLVAIKPTSSQLASDLTLNKLTSKESQGISDLKHKSSSDSSVPVVLKVASLAPSARTSGQFMRLRLIEEIRKKKDLEAQQAAANAKAKPITTGSLPQSSNGVGIPSQALRVAPSQNTSLGQGRKTSMPPLQAALPNAKRQKGDSLSPSGPSQVQPPYAVAQSSAPMYNNMGHVGNLGVNLQQNEQRQQQQRQQQRQQQLMQGQQLDVKLPQRQGSPPSNIQRQQQQQLFQSSLTPEEQQAFKQLQSKMSTFLQMGNTGSAPNGQQLTPHQKQQALQQAKLVQQQLLQKFPVYFQRLRQFQLIQQQRQQRQAMSGMTQDQSVLNGRQTTPRNTDSPMPNGINTTFHQSGAMINQLSGQPVMGGQSPQSMDKKKRTYKKKG